MYKDINDLPADRLSCLPTVYDLPDFKPWEWTKPRRREFMKGAVAALCGVYRGKNPWRREIGGRYYGAFEHSWNVGFDAATRALMEKE